MATVLEYIMSIITLKIWDICSLTGRVVQLMIDKGIAAWAVVASAAAHHQVIRQSRCCTKNFDPPENDDGKLSPNSLGLISPLESILAFSPEEVDVVLEDQLENVIFIDSIAGIRLSHGVAQQR